jgi:hypothetical protein
MPTRALESLDLEARPGTWRNVQSISVDVLELRSRARRIVED